MRHQVDVAGDTIAALEHAIHALRNAGAPDDTTLRVKTAVAWSADGGRPTTLTARWDDNLVLR